MKQYPSINGQIIQGKPYFAFDKLDGSSIRTEWNPKKGFYKFGSRTVLFDERSSDLGKFSIPLIKAQEEQFSKIFSRLRIQREATCFFEFFGNNSFAGLHRFDVLDNHKAVLIDVNLFKIGFVSPKFYVENFIESELVESAPLLYHGNITSDFIKSIKDSTLEGMGPEGVVCKGAPLKNGFPPYMFKIKSNAWIDKVKALYPNDFKKQQELL